MAGQRSPAATMKRPLRTSKPRHQATSDITDLDTSKCTSDYTDSFQVYTIAQPKRKGLSAQRLYDQVSLQGGDLHTIAGQWVYVEPKTSRLQFGPRKDATSEDVHGWSICSDGSLALGTHTLFQRCSNDLYLNPQPHHRGCEMVKLVAKNGYGHTIGESSKLNPGLVFSNKGGGSKPSELNGSASASPSAAWIAGATVGGIALILLVLCILLFRLQRQTRRNPDDSEDRAHIIVVKGELQDTSVAPTPELPSDSTRLELTAEPPPPPQELAAPEDDRWPISPMSMPEKGGQFELVELAA